MKSLKMVEPHPEQFNEREWDQAAQISFCFTFMLIHLIHTCKLKYRKGIRKTKISMLPFYLSLGNSVIFLMFFLAFMAYDFENYYVFELWATVCSRIIYMTWHANCCLITLTWDLLTSLLRF